MAGLVQEMGEREREREEGRLEGWGGRKEKEKGRELKCNGKSKGLGIRQLSPLLVALGSY